MLRLDKTAFGIIGRASTDTKHSLDKPIIMTFIGRNAS